MTVSLPDVASGQLATTTLPLKWVGMEKIAIPLEVEISSTSYQRVNALANIFVSLDKPEAKGIHMSRLYIRLREILSTTPLNIKTIEALLKESVQSQQGLSKAAKLELQFEVTIDKPALLSDQFGYQSYPITLNCEYINSELSYELSLTIAYSSTCPCSAALSRQALSEEIEEQFSHEMISKHELMTWITSLKGSIATPHSQRSFAYVTVKLTERMLPLIPNLIKALEQTIGTPVQTAVKREDEQAFAKLNAENLMFCEDAARRVKQFLETCPQFIDYWFKVEHQESLHAHNAVVVDHKFPTHQLCG
ncbi:GTP cyclohydrolase FolE2 [Pseudoalteromonas sp. PS5]|uniref:GTP cyclohydrolase FolE2 n=1 Tax=Pseudoalteromonas sp. PS5 TaxID=1437473 RepID=UPI000FFEC7F6|nr:GTP cyclohydrolase FolE2 [Pseudoalteromonas sp. PS5]RXE95117.1 GTP cyclohydrolase I FolE2 [Pseudoalteromonas sp. PS5]